MWDDVLSLEERDGDACQFGHAQTLAHPRLFVTRDLIGGLPSPHPPSPNEKNSSRAAVTSIASRFARASAGLSHLFALPRDCVRNRSPALGASAHLGNRDRRGLARRAGVVADPEDQVADRQRE